MSEFVNSDIGGTAGDAYQALKTTNKYQQFIIDTSAPNCFLKLNLGWFNL
jgi:hypothetical protein